MLWPGFSGVLEEGPVSDESTALTLSNRPQKHETSRPAALPTPAADPQWACGCPPPSPASLAAQVKTPLAMVEVARAARAAKTC